MENFMKYADDKKRISLIKRRLKQGWTLTAIAEEIEISISAISHYCTRNGIEHNRDLRIDYNDVKIKKLIRKKVPLAAISEKLGIPYRRLYAHCKKRNFDFISRGWIDGHYDYSEVSTLASEGMTTSGISKKLKIPYHSVYDYCRYHRIDVKKQNIDPEKRKEKNEECSNDNLFGSSNVCEHRLR